MTGLISAHHRQLSDQRHVIPDCDIDHAYNESFEHPWIDAQAQIRLLKVLVPCPDTFDDVKCSLHVVPVTDLPRIDYVALSYFWGVTRSSNDVHQITVDNKPYWVRTNLWDFLRFARVSDHSLPIYIDAICLNQLDNEERGHQVKLMSEIYSHANLAHVWLGSLGAEQSENLRSLQSDLSRHVPHTSWNSRSFIGLSYVCSRDYWRRLWIVQELLLSKDAEIHCGPFTFAWDELSQLAKLPLSANILEEPERITWWDAWNSTQLRDASQQRIRHEGLFDGWQFALRLFHYRNEWLSRGYGTSQHKFGLPIDRAVIAFQFQQCRDREDKIYALIGLLDTDGRSMITPSYHASLHQVFVDAAAACLVSRWREGNDSTSDFSLTVDDRMYCNRLNTILELTLEDIEARMQEALNIAISYTRSMRTVLEIPAAQSHRVEQIRPFRATTRQPLILAKPPLVQNHQQSADTTFEYIFEDFIGHLTVADRADFAGATPRSLNATIAVIQNRQRANKEMRNMTRLRGFIEQMTTYHEVLDTLLGIPNIVAFVWACSFLLPFSTPD
jgi:hypothetical protein